MTSQAVGLGAAVDYLDRPRHGRRRRARARADRLRARRRCADVPGRARHRPGRRRRPAAGRSRSPSTACTRTTSARCSTTAGIAVRVGPPLRPAAAPPLRGAGHHPRHASPSTTRRTRSTRWSTACDAAPRVLRGELPMNLEPLYQEIILDHYRNPHGRGPARAVRRRGAPRQPDLRRRGHAAGAPGRHGDGDRRATSPTTTQGCSISQASTSVLTDLVDRPAGRRGAGARTRRSCALMQGHGRGRARRGRARATRSPSPASRSTRRGSSARCWAGWPGRTRAARARRPRTADARADETTSATSDRRP